MKRQGKQKSASLLLALAMAIGLALPVFAQTMQETAAQVTAPEETLTPETVEEEDDLAADDAETVMHTVTLIVDDEPLLAVTAYNSEKSATATATYSAQTTIQVEDGSSLFLQYGATVNRWKIYTEPTYQVIGADGTVLKSGSLTNAMPGYRYESTGAIHQDVTVRCTAKFEEIPNPTGYTITLADILDGIGTAEISDGTTTTTDKIEYGADGGKSREITITVRPNRGYKFTASPQISFNHHGVEINSMDWDGEKFVTTTHTRYDETGNMLIAVNLNNWTDNGYVDVMDGVDVDSPKLESTEPNSLYVYAFLGAGSGIPASMDVTVTFSGDNVPAELPVSFGHTDGRVKLTDNACTFTLTDVHQYLEIMGIPDGVSYTITQVPHRENYTFAYYRKTDATHNDTKMQSADGSFDGSKCQHWVYIYMEEENSAPEPTTTPDTNTGWVTENGKQYWYENGVKQGTTGRGKEIYDPASDAWYWLDAVQGGAVAKSKDVYQESSGGKWVRYDADGHMVKGWQTTDAGTYYFDPITGAMAKGDVVIDGLPCSFDSATGIGLNKAWKQIDGKDYWYENGKRQGYDPDNAAYRGKEIYDPASDAWYWLDNVQQGAKAVSKDVYQESDAGQWADRADGTGKWVRYDANGHMIKGWSTTASGTYYFDLVYGTMAKGEAVIDGKTYRFDTVTGILK